MTDNMKGYVPLTQDQLDLYSAMLEAPVTPKPETQTSDEENNIVRGTD